MLCTEKDGINKGSRYPELLCNNLCQIEDGTLAMTRRSHPAHMFNPSVHLRPVLAEPMVHSHVATRSP